MSIDSYKWAFQIFTYLSSTLMILIAFTFFLFSMLALLTSPAWLPYVVDKLMF
jgi:hypothetical protein